MNGGLKIPKRSESVNLRMTDNDLQNITHKTH
jgi:hypothetical protein